MTPSMRRFESAADSLMPIPDCAAMRWARRAKQMLLDCSSCFKLKAPVAFPTIFQDKLFAIEVSLLLAGEAAAVL